MCTVMLNIDEAQVRKAYPELTSMEAITHWAQQLVDTRIADLVEAEEEYPLPEGVKPYTMEEINARIDKAERDSAEGRSRDFDDFMRELRQQFAEEDMREEMEMLEAV